MVDGRDGNLAFLGEPTAEEFGEFGRLLAMTKSRANAAFLTAFAFAGESDVDEGDIYGSRVSNS